MEVLYGFIEWGLLCYDLYVNTLKEFGFAINTYNWFVANKIINEKQCTILWYVDNNKVSHIGPKVNTTIIRAISKRFGNLVIKRGRKHTFLGIDIELLDGNKLSICTKNYIRESINLFDEDVSTK